MTDLPLNLEIIYRPLASIRAPPRNARTHSEQQIGQIVRSFRTFGVVNPILIDEDNVVIAGHARLAAAKAMGLTELATIQLRHLKDRQKRALMLADNKLALNAGWDIQTLAGELQELSLLESEIDVEVTGFSMGEIDLAIEQALPHPDPLDALPEGEDQPLVSASGDLWHLGPHRLLCGSALDQASYVRVLDSEMAQMVFTDPPYNVPIQGHVSGLGKARHGEFKMASGEMSVAAFTDFLSKVHRLMAEHVVDGSILFTCMDWRHLRELISPHWVVRVEC